MKTIISGVFKQETNRYAPALSPMDIRQLPLAHSRRPIWPLDNVEKPY